MVVIPGVNTAIPHHWALPGFKNVMTRNMGLADAWLPCAVLLAMSAVFFIVGGWRFKFE